METTLLAKVGMLLTMSLLLGGFGAWLGRNIRSIVAFIVLAIAFIGGVFALSAMAAVSPTAGIITLAGWTFISGLFIGPALESYVEDLGYETVVLAFLGTAGVMAVCGGIGAFSGLNFAALGSILFIALFGLIIAGIIGCFVKMGRSANIVYSSLGMLIFGLYFVYDFFTIKTTANSWENATMLTAKVYLDFVNFLLHLLQLLSVLHHK